MDELLETKLYRQPHEVNKRLAELGLHREGLLRVRSIAIGASADATPFHPANAAGTLSYLYGTWALRDVFVGEDWQIDQSDGVEAIRNDKLKIKALFGNVDVACDDNHPPKPRSRKGAGTERACMGNLFGFLPAYSPKPEEEWATYYLMVDSNGAAEFTCPVVQARTFSSYVERIFIAASMDDRTDGITRTEDDSPVDIEPIVARK